MPSSTGLTSMDRYQVAVKAVNKKRSFSFPDTISAIRTAKYVKYCIVHEGIFNAKNIPQSTLDPAVVKIGKELNSPIIVQTKKDAQVLSMAYSYARIYSLDEIPEDIYAIYYNCKPPVGHRSYTIIFY